MISDLDIHRFANLFVQQHGGDAPIKAAIRADSMLNKAALALGDFLHGFDDAVPVAVVV